jgi:tetratricopeptide (TPR) repeat protein
MMIRFYLIVYFISAALFCDASQLQEANEIYQKGLKAATWQERLTSFNDALLLYTKIENSEGASPQITQTLGDLYVELSEYPWAILYYERNLMQSPDNPYTLSHLNAVQKKLGLKLTTPQERPLWRSALLDSVVSQPMKLELFFWVSVATIILAASYIWFPKPFVKKGIVIAGCFSTLILLCYFILFYFSPIEGIIVSPSGLYREANPYASQVVSTPLFGGEKVRVIETEIEGSWLKVINKDGQLGFVPGTAIRII